MNQPQQKLQRKQDVVQRKTSAEIVNEAKNMLAGGTLTYRIKAKLFLSAIFYARKLLLVL